jgi:hypothetical protein
MTETYRDPAKQSPAQVVLIEDVLRDVLRVLEPLDQDETTRVLLAVSALYDLGLMRDDDVEAVKALAEARGARDERRDEEAEEET